MAKIQYLSPEDVQTICEELLSYFSKLKDPPPEYTNSYFDKLDSILAIPQKTFGKQDLYPSIFQKAACYMFFITKLHPFNNGNKRMSIVATGVFLEYNGYELDADMEQLYEFAKVVTVTHDDQRRVLQDIADFLEKNSKKHEPRNIATILFDTIRKLFSQLPLQKKATSVTS
ncbi:MAG: type II toxin-antitoxin system death-on-curing family toxin [Weeksellaceae bacterium]